MRRRNSPWLGLVNAFLGGLAASGTVVVAACLAVIAEHVGGLLGLLVLTTAALVLGALLSGFLLTIVFPGASEWGATAGFALLWILVVLAKILNVADLEILTVVLMIMPVLGLCMASYGGVLLARRIGPRRCRDFSFTPRGEPRCPGCGYVLYYAANLTCPECGRRFTLREIDTRLSEWKDGMLQPWRSARAE